MVSTVYPPGNLLRGNSINQLWFVPGTGLHAVPDYGSLPSGYSDSKAILKGFSKKIGWFNFKGVQIS